VSRASDERAISPVVGVALLVVIAVLLTAVTAGFVLELGTEREPAPDVALTLEPADDGMAVAHRLAHTDGDRLDGEQVTLRGVANPDGLSGGELSAGQRHSLYPVDTTVQVVWTGDHGTTYVLREFEVDPDDTVPEPDEGCDWVDSESNGGVDDVKVDGLVVNCDVQTDKVVEVSSGGAVIGDTASDAKTVDVDDGELYGDARAEDVVNVQDGTVAGSAVSATGDVKVDGSRVGGAARAQRTVEVVNDGSVDGDAVSDANQVKVVDGDVSGAVTGDSVKLQSATVEGDVYVDPSNFDCSGSTIAGQSCSEYSPRDPDDYGG